MTRLEQTRQPPVDRRARGGKYLTFRLDEGDYGVGILKVQEIIAIQSITRVPQAPHSVRGVINLRGRVIPVLDLRRHFSLPDLPEDAGLRKCIVIVRVAREGTEAVIGVLVDSVSEVLDIPDAQIELPADFRDRAQTSFLLGMGKVDERVVLLLDIDRVVSTGMLGQMVSMAGQKRARAGAQAPHPLAGRR
jgi:purine-binding chemotaxis protein CheW